MSKIELKLFVLAKNPLGQTKKRRWKTQNVKVSLQTTYFVFLTTFFQKDTVDETPIAYER